MDDLLETTCKYHQIIRQKRNKHYVTWNYCIYDAFDGEKARCILLGECSTCRKCSKKEQSAQEECLIYITSGKYKGFEFVGYYVGHKNVYINRQNPFQSMREAKRKYFFIPELKIVVSEIECKWKSIQQAE